MIQRDGGVLLVEGAAGIGKTSLLQRVRGFARGAGVRVLEASGGELERDFPYGVVRQLFGPVMHEVDAELPALLAGAAALAGPIVASGTALASEPGPDRRVRGAARPVLAHRQPAHREPLVVLVDDAHWADAPSLRYLAFLARRLEGISALVVLGVRPDEPGEHTAPLAQIATAPTTRVLRPAALSEHASAQLIGRALGEPDPRFVGACLEATGGRPFLLYELAAALAADGVAPGAAAAARVSALGPTTVAHATLLRIGRLGRAAVPLAYAVAVLGADAQLGRALRLAELDEPTATDALDALAAASVLRTGARLEFVHPIVRAAVYEQLGPGARSAVHARAAQLLQAGGAELDAVAAHLLATEPSGQADVVARLRAAAGHALARGAPENAARYLRRALAEGGDPALSVTLRFEARRGGEADSAAERRAAPARGAGARRRPRAARAGVLRAGRGAALFG